MSISANYLLSSKGDRPRNASNTIVMVKFILEKVLIFLYVLFILCWMAIGNFPFFTNNISVLYSKQCTFTLINGRVFRHALYACYILKLKRVLPPIFNLGY